MAQMNNLTEDNILDLQKLFEEKIQPVNSQATLKIFEQTASEDNEIQLLRHEIAGLKEMIRHIFDGHVLIQGEWVKLRY
jgi:hypothetical protein